MKPVITVVSLGPGDPKLLTLRFGLEGGKPMSTEETGRLLDLLSVGNTYFRSDCVCDNIFENGKTCQEIGAMITYNEKLKKDEINWEGVVVFTWQKTFCFPDNLFFLIITLTLFR